MNDSMPPFEKSHKPRESSVKVAGIASVRALFNRDPERVIRFFYADTKKGEVGEFCKEMARQKKPYRLLSQDELEKVAGTAMHGGVAAVARSKKQPTLDPAHYPIWAEEGYPLLLLDGVSNPQNLGAILRTVAFFGIPRVIVSTHPDQAKLSDATYRIAEGGIEYIDIYTLERGLKDLEEIGQYFDTYATVLEGGVPLSSIKETGRPALFVMGNEEIGLKRETIQACKGRVTIPGSRHVQSLNVAASTAIFLYSAMADINRS